MTIAVIFLNSIQQRNCLILMIYRRFIAVFCDCRRFVADVDLLSAIKVHSEHVSDFGEFRESYAVFLTHRINSLETGPPSFENMNLFQSAGKSLVTDGRAATQGLFQSQRSVKSAWRRNLHAVIIYRRVGLRNPSYPESRLA